jgi:alkylmercury lyase
MSSNPQAETIGGVDWWERQRRELPDFELLFGADGVVPHAYRLLAEGRPATLDRLAAATTRSVPEVEAVLRRQSGTDWDDEGRLVGFGLTLRPTPHRFTFDNGRTVYTWCASDALVIPVVVGRSAVLESPCPATGRRIRVEMTPKRVVSVDPTDAVVSLVRPERMDDIRGEVCSLGSFFASEGAAAEWVAANPDGMVHRVEDDFRLHREIALHLGWQAPAAEG